MRPAGEVGLALLKAAAELEHEVDGRRHGPTLQEMAQRACVGLQAARHTVQNLHRAGKLKPVADRRVPYRNRPVVEYAPARETRDPEVIDVESVFAVWAQG